MNVGVQADEHKALEPLPCLTIEGEPLTQISASERGSLDVVVSGGFKISQQDQIELAMEISKSVIVAVLMTGRVHVDSTKLRTNLNRISIEGPESITERDPAHVCSRTLA